MKPALFLRFLITAATLFAIWLLLSGKVDLLHGGLGLAGSLVIAWMFYPKEGSLAFPVLRFLIYVPWQIWQVVLSNWAVAKIVLKPTMPIEPQFVRIAPMVQDARAVTLLGCGITLTPGTLTVDATREELIVHALDRSTARDVEARTIEKKVAVVFGEAMG